MEKRFYFDSGRNYFGSVKVGDFFTDRDPIKGEANIFVRIEPEGLCNVVNLETGETSAWLDDKRVYLVKSAEIDIQM